jgi:excisionase family DNA binding protein
VPELLTISEASAALSVSRATIFRMLRAKELTRYKRRGSTATFIDRKQLERLLRPRPEK